MIVSYMEVRNKIKNSLIFSMQLLNALVIFVGTVLLLAVSSFVYDNLGLGRLIAIGVGTVVGLCPITIYSYFSITNLWKLKQNIVIHFVSGFICYVMFVAVIYVWLIIMKRQLYHYSEFPILVYAAFVLSVGGILVNLSVYCWVAWHNRLRRNTDT